MLDTQRADVLEAIVGRFTAEVGTRGFIVLESHEGKGHWKGMDSWDTIFDNYKEDPGKVLENDPRILPEDFATIIMTSGTTVRTFSAIFTCHARKEKPSNNL